MSPSESPNVVGFRQPADFYYRTAVRAMQAQDFPTAVQNARTAVRMAPQNVEYELLLAGALSEVHRYDESTRVLFRLLEKNCGVDSECFYLLGTNFMSSHDYEQAQECFEEYLSLEPNGRHNQEIDQFMALIDAQEEDGLLYFEDVNEHEAHVKATQAKVLLEAGQYERAIHLLESIPSSQAELPYVQNNLALAYFCSGRRDKGVEITKKVLVRDPGNIHAICNLATFTHDLGKKDECEASLQQLDTMEAESNEDIFKIAVTFCELGKHELAYQHLHAYNQLGQMDVQSLFFEAIAAHNTHRFKEAVSALSTVRKIDDSPVIADYFIRTVHGSEEDEGNFRELPYLYALPTEEARKKVYYLNNCLRLDDEQFQQLWLHDREFEETVKWALEHGDENIQISIAVMTAGFADPKAEELLREFLLRRHQSDSVKNEIFILLHHMGAKEPYISFVGSEVVEVRLGMGDVASEKMSTRSTSLMGLIQEITASVHRDELLEEILEMAAKAIHSEHRTVLFTHLPELAVAIVWIVADAHLNGFDLLPVCERFGAQEIETRKMVDILLDLS